jgi:hypothetical protein
MRHPYTANTVTLNLFQGPIIAVPSKIKMLKQVQHDGFGKLGLGQ